MKENKYRLLDISESKPINYHFLSTKLSEFYDFSKNDLAALEKVLLKSVVILPPREQQVPICEVKLFEGSKKAVAMLFCSKITLRQKPISRFLLNSCRIRYN